MALTESEIEQRLKKLEDYGFLVLKLTTPGNSGVMDRMILWPTWAPAPPEFVEVKRPNQRPRPLQEATAENWLARGCVVNPYVDSYTKVDKMVRLMLIAAVRRYERNITNALVPLPEHIKLAYNAALRIERLNDGVSYL